MARNSKEVKDHLGHVYPDTVTMCIAYKIPLQTYKARRAKGYSVQQALEIHPQRRINEEKHKYIFSFGYPKMPWEKENSMC